MCVCVHECAYQRQGSVIFSFLVCLQEARAQCFSQMLFVELNCLQILKHVLSSERPGSFRGFMQVS